MLYISGNIIFNQSCINVVDDWCLLIIHLHSCIWPDVHLLVALILILLFIHMLHIWPSAFIGTWMSKYLILPMNHSNTNCASLCILFILSLHHPLEVIFPIPISWDKNIAFKNFSVHRLSFFQNFLSLADNLNFESSIHFHLEQNHPWHILTSLLFPQIQIWEERNKTLERNMM